MSHAKCVQIQISQNATKGSSKTWPVRSDKYPDIADSPVYDDDKRMRRRSKTTTDQRQQLALYLVAIVNLDVIGRK